MTPCLIRRWRSDRYIHLTNSSIQKQSTLGPTQDNPVTGADGGGSKISLSGASGLWARLRASGVDAARVWRSVCLLVLKSLVAVDDVVAHQPCAFEVFGYDVLLDADLRPWLLEVNASPSLARENALDCRVKEAVLRDTVRLLDAPPFDRARLLQVLRRRLADTTATALEDDIQAIVRALLRAVALRCPFTLQYCL